MVSLLPRFDSAIFLRNGYYPFPTKTIRTAVKADIIRPINSAGFNLINFE